MQDNGKKSLNGSFVERRRFPRLNVSVDIEYSILKKESLHGNESITKNISAGGICLIVYEDVKVGSLLDLKINISEINYSINVKGKVIWSSSFSIGSDQRDRYDLGIEFTDINETDRQKISQYVFKLLQ